MHARIEVMKHGMSEKKEKETCVKSVMIPLRLSMHIPSLTMLVQFSARSEGNIQWIVRHSKPISHR